MKNNVMREKFKNIIIRASYFLFALFISIALWMFVQITENEMQIREIQVNEIIRKNQELLDSRNLLISSVLTENPTITFEAPLVEINKLIADGISIEVDLENIRSTGTARLDYEVILPDNVNKDAITMVGPASPVIMVIDRLYSREFKVEVEYTGGTVSAEYMVDTPEIDPLTVVVSGPEAIVSRISHVYVPIVAENLSTTYADELGFVLVDEDGEIINGDLIESEILTFSDETIHVTIPIKQIKTIPLQVEFSHGLTTSDSNTSRSVEPSEVTIAGDPAIIRDINSIMLGTIDMTSFALSTTREFQILYPNNVTPVSGETRATVLVEVRGLTREYRSVSTIQTSNLPAGYSAVIQSQSLDVSIRGTPEDLAAVRAENIWVVADLTDIGTGTSRVIARAYIAGVDAAVDITLPRSDEEYRIVVTVTDDNAP